MSSFSTKSPLASLTIIGVVISALSKVIGVEVSDHEANTAIEAVKVLWPIILGLGADAAAAWHRVKASNFNKHVLETRTFWLAVASAVFTIIAAFGFDVTGFESILQKGMSAGPAIAALGGVVLIIIGRWKAQKKIA